MTGDAQMPAPDLDEERVAFCCPYREEMTNRPDGDANQPETKAEADGPGQRAVDNGDGARCAAEQGRFWEFHEELFAKSPQLAPEQLLAIANAIGLDAAKFEDCVKTRRFQAKVDADVAVGKKSGVAGTPAFFVNGVPLSGGRSVEDFAKVINTELLDISASRASESIRARVENSHGILKDCFQQSVVQLAQAYGQVDGDEIFPDFTAKLEQSVRLRDGLAALIKAIREFQAARD